MRHVERSYCQYRLLPCGNVVLPVPPLTHRGASSAAPRMQYASWLGPSVPVAASLRALAASALAALATSFGKFLRAGQREAGAEWAAVKSRGRE